MNLYLRLLLMFIRARFKGPVSMFDEFISSHRVLPNDLDPLGHMNNGRYFAVSDLVRIEILIRAGIWGAMKKRNVYAVVAGETVQFRKPLMPFQKYRILTRTLGWDEKFLYVEHRFISQKATHALMLIRVRVLGTGRVRVSPADILRTVTPGRVDESHMSGTIESWTDSARRHWDGLLVN